MRRALAAIAIAFLFLGACGSDDDTEAGDTATSSTAPEGDEDHDDEGEGRDPDALFGQDVCAALLQALEGNTDGLDRYADDDVLAELSADPFHGKSDDVTITADGETCTMSPFGDGEYVLTLMGDGHVGQRAIAIDFVLGGDSGGGGETSVGDAIDAERASGSACGDDSTAEGDQVLDIDSGTVVALQCESFAYQSTFDLYRFDGERLVPLSVELWLDGSVEEGMGILGYPFVEDGLLANVEKARGIGDCGVYSQWFLDGDALLLSAVFAQECDDSGEPVGPEEWPQVYPGGA